MYIPCIFIVHYLLFAPTNTHICIKTLKYITNAPTCFGAAAPPSRKFDIAFVKL
jgi:hypothetical protein